PALASRSGARELQRARMAHVWEYIVIAAVIVVIAVALTAFLVPRRRARRVEPPAQADRRDAASRSGTAVESPAPDSGVEQRPADQRPADHPGTEPPVTELPAPEEPAVERPEPAAGRLVRLRSRLARSQTGLGKGLLALLSRERLDEDTWEEIEDTLLAADLGVAPAGELVERLRTRARVEGIADAEAARRVLREELIALVDPTLDRTLRTDRHVEDARPAVVMVVGVNGTGKTTTVGKLARVLVAEDRDV